MNAHAIALVGPFLTAGKQLHCPPQLLIRYIFYLTSLCGCLTHYASASNVLYFSQGYVSLGRFLFTAFLVSILYVGVFSTVGLGYWKLLGYW
jgi:DASS family divalent anion:Na+ symporter